MISVIIPVYNAQEVLSEAIESVLNQSYRNFELLLVDDGSTDASPSICDSFALKDDRVRVIHKKNGGVSSARNCGLDAAKGELISAQGGLSVAGGCRCLTKDGNTSIEKEGYIPYPLQA